MSIENQNRDPLTLNHSDGTKARADMPIADTEIPDCWHAAMAMEKGLGREHVLTCWHLAHDYRDKLLKLAEPDAMELPRCTGGDSEQALEVIWAVLQNWHECKPVTEESQTQWDDICTAMAWIREATNLPSEIEAENQGQGKYSDDEYIETAKRMLGGDNFDIAPNAPVSTRPGEGGARVQVWRFIDDYEVAETATRKGRQ